MNSTDYLFKTKLDENCSKNLSDSPFLECYYFTYCLDYSVKHLIFAYFIYIHQFISLCNFIFNRQTIVLIEEPNISLLIIVNAHKLNIALNLLTIV